MDYDEHISDWRDVAGKKTVRAMLRDIWRPKKRGGVVIEFCGFSIASSRLQTHHIPKLVLEKYRLLGTKWDSTAGSVVLSQTDEHTYNLNLIFETANSHPFESVIGMAEQFFLIDNSLIMNIEFSDEQPDQNFGAYRISTSKDNPNLFCSEGFHVGFIGYADSDDVGPLRGQIKHLESSPVCCSWPKIFQREKRFLASNA